MDSLAPELSKAWLADKDGVQADAYRTASDEDAGRLTAALEALCLTHRRCNAAGADNTAEVTERARRKNEAELFARSRKRA